jgi:NADPH-dependent 2,4-dienoyl-CoA reductase/sulfur reductase-like enzyme
LLIATGVKPKLPDIPGTSLKNVFTLTNFDDAMRIDDALRSAQRVAIVGAGYVGLEMAECLHSLGKTVYVYEREPHVLPGMDDDMAKIIEYELQRFGIGLSTSARVLALVGSDQSVSGVKAASGLGIHPADMVLLDTGVEPRVELARTAEIQIGLTGAIAVNAHMETNVPGIYAAGNCAETFCPIRRRPVLNFIGTVAAKQGRVAGENLASRRTKFAGAIRHHGVEGIRSRRRADRPQLRRCRQPEASPSLRRASKRRTEPLITRRHERSGSSYWPNGESRKIIGAQAIGYGDASKRIDVAAAAITAGMRVDELAQLDLAYSPPFGNLWDPMLLAAQAVLRKLAVC